VTTEIWIIIIIAAVMAVATVFLIIELKKPKTTEVDKENIKVLAEYVKADKQQKEQQIQLKELKRADQKQKLETFKQTREQLKEKLRAQFGGKDWQPLSKILKSADKGGMGIYVLFNATKNKYYVGQAKQIYKRIREHFCVEEIARDFMFGDEIRATFLPANELDENYRIDHIERIGIEIFDAEKGGYNKKPGSI
jgi:hypothetical protein